MNEKNKELNEQNDKTIIIGESDTQTLRQMADKPAGGKRFVRRRKTLDSINKNAKWYPFRVAWFVISKALSYVLNTLLTVMLICAVRGCGKSL